MLNKLRFEELKDLFYKKYPNGFITKSYSNNKNVEVNFINGGKTYTYKNTPYYIISILLGVNEDLEEKIKQDNIKAQKELELLYEENEFGLFWNQDSSWFYKCNVGH